jgi:hypothetical protein
MSFATDKENAAKTSLTERITGEFGLWFDSLKLYAGFPAKGTISGALVVLDQLKENFTLDIDEHTAKGGSQVKGASGEAVKRILAKFGEVRPFVAEGGRTNRGLRGDIRGMLEVIAATGMKESTSAQRITILEELQRFLVGKVGEFHNRQRIKFIYDVNKTTRQCVKDILAAARQTAKEGPVAQYLIGAKLQLRFPDKQIENKSYSTADEQQNRPGDFFVGTTAFHVTIAPMPAVFEKCQRNSENGLRPFLLVPEHLLQAARQIAGLKPSVPIEVESIESFVAQNIFELSEFSSDLLPAQFRRLLEVYNERVDPMEIDKSMLIQTPANLLNQT